MKAPRLSIGLGSFLVALALVVAVGIGSAIAVIPNQGTYYACLTKSSGAVKVINYPKVQCATGTRLIKWNTKGPAGPQGSQGAQGALGPQGPKGDQGPAGPADWNAISNRPAGFADGVDDQGVTGLTITRVQGPYTQVYANASGTAWDKLTSTVRPGRASWVAATGHPRMRSPSTLRRQRTPTRGPSSPPSSARRATGGSPPS